MKPFEHGRPTFELGLPFQYPAHGRVFGPLKRLLERLLLRKLDEFYAEVAQRDDARHFIDRVLETLNSSYELAKGDLEQVPATGGLVVLANHPFGMLDGVILASILRSVRPDFKILANTSLNRITELCDTLIHVDPYGKSESIKANSRSIREAIAWLRSGGALGVFPAGEVAHIDLLKREVTDPEWLASVARIIRKSEAPALPIFLNGLNGPLFQLAGLIHPRLRTVMLPHELLNKRDTRTEVRIGSLIPFEGLAAFETDEGMIDYLRRRTYLLGSRQSRRRDQRLGVSGKNDEPIAAAVPAAMLAREIRTLPPEQTLVVSGSCHVFHAQAAQIPNILQEIGRLRETTFRAANEGTGKATELDEFDLQYVHLLLWNQDTSEIIGAYRLGRTDEILNRFGRPGLYTSTLFKYGAVLLAEINPALELGRSFVRPEYQKTFPPLFLLWKEGSLFCSDSI